MPGNLNILIPRLSRTFQGVRTPKACSRDIRHECRVNFDVVMHSSPP